LLTDLATRCRLGGGDDLRAKRKRALTPAASSRWAGAVTRTSNDQWQRGRRNLLDARIGLRRACGRIRSRLAVPVGGHHAGVRGYASQAERFAKQGRLQRLEARLVEVERRIAKDWVSVSRGGRRLAKLRHAVDREDLPLSHVEWRERWQAARLFLTADGEAGKRWGNETIRVHPDQGWLELRLPTPLGHLSNTSSRAATYRLERPVTFTHRRDEWAAQATSGAVAYTIWLDPQRGRWYLDASWRLPALPTPSLEALRQHPVLAVDLNADHLAGWVLNAAGNPLGLPVSITLALEGLPAPTRDGRLRAAVAEMVHLAVRQRCRALVVEHPDFADARQAARETLGRGRRGKRFRRVVAGMPTRRFRELLAGMAANGGWGGGPGLDFGVGRALLGGPTRQADQGVGQGVAASRGRAGDRQAWARAPSPATGVVCLAATGGSPTESCRLRRAAHDSQCGFGCDGGRVRARGTGTWRTARTAGRATHSGPQDLPARPG
jgi:hypothetical protein